jgi:EmrB/QacA subfamily drug resistance transporter
MTHAARTHHNLTFGILALAGTSFALIQSLVAPALLTIQHDLHTTTAVVAWVFTGYLLSASIATPVLGRLGDMYGKKRLLVITLWVLAVGVLISALATSIGVLIFGRVVQGVGGAVFPLAYSIIRDEFPRERVATAIALISALLGVGGGLGIILAGPITQQLSYHWLFWLPLFAVVIAAIAAQIVIPESPIKTSGRVDLVGGLLLAGWLSALLIAVSEGSTWGWGSLRVIGLASLAAVVLAAWVKTEERMFQPLVDMRMMRRRGVWTTNLTALLLGFGMYSSFILVPEFVEHSQAAGFGFSASVTQAGLFLLPSTLGVLVSSPAAGRLTNSVGPRSPLIIGAFLTAASFCLLTVAHSSRWEIYVSMSLMGIGIGFAFASMVNLIVEAVGPHETGIATGMNTIVRMIGGGLGAQITASIILGNTERDFTLAFGACAVALTLCVLTSLAVPARNRTDFSAALEHA